MIRQMGLLGCLVLLAGCSMEGNWQLRDVRPPEARETFDLAAVTFNPDYTYVASFHKGDRTEISRGTYDYDEWARRLTLSSHGTERSFKATLILWLQMNIETHAPDGTPVRAIMVRSRQAVNPDAPIARPKP